MHNTSVNEKNKKNRRSISWRNYQIGEDLLDALAILNADFDIVQLSSRGWDLLGLETEVERTGGFCEIIHEKDRIRVKSALAHSLKGNTTIDTEIRLKPEGDQQRWAHLRAVPMNERQLIFVTVYNISTYSAEISQLSRFFSMSPDLFCLMDFDGNFIRINIAWEQLLGWPIETLVKNDFSSLVHPSDQEHTKAQYLNNTAGADSVLFENRYRTIDGTYKWIEWKTVSLMDEKLIFANARDITARKEFEKKLREMAAAEIANQTKSTFLSAMSHELRTPLNGILGAVNIAYEESENESQKDILNTLRVSAESLGKIIEDVLDFTRIDAGQIELDTHSFSVRALISEIVQMNSIIAKSKGIDLVVTVEKDVPDILENDSNRLGQVLRNLIENAVRFTNAGKVEIKVSPIVFSTEKTFCEATNVNKNDDFCWLRFVICDTGVGISDDQKVKIFDAFHQAQEFMIRKTGGLGIGLSISRQLVELMGGSISVSSALEEGSEFAIYLPFRILHESTFERAKAITEKSVLRPMHILVVEDNIVNQKVVIRFLTKQGHSVVIAANGRLALDAFEKEMFDMILMDIQMPEMDGITATMHIRDSEREGRARTPIIAMTAHAAKSDELACYAAGMDDFIVKPFKPEKLRLALARFSST